MTPKPIYQWASTEVLAAVVDVEIAALLRRAPSKEEALLALAARRELEDRMRRHRWLAMETTRKAGATWAEIAAAAGMGPLDARRLYEQTLAVQKAFGYAEPPPPRPRPPGAVGDVATQRQPARAAGRSAAAHDDVEDTRPVPSRPRCYPLPRPAPSPSSLPPQSPYSPNQPVSLPVPHPSPVCLPSPADTSAPGVRRVGLAGGGERLMMGLAKIAPDGWVYYAREIAAGVEDYFVGHGKETGRWVGRGADGLGLSGEVDSEGLSRLFGQGFHPVTGEGLGRPFRPDDKTAVAGYAMSFSPPKSVSVLWALAPADIADQVREAHDAAVAAALEFLQDHAAFCRRGHGGTVQEATGGYLAAVFVHRTSRAGDPQIHNHILVANKVQAVSDGRWLTVDGRELYEVQKAAGMLYKAALRAELTARLGVAWGEVDGNGGAEIEGVPEHLITSFSKRRAQVEAAAARLVGERETLLGRSLTGDERAAIFQLAAYQSRAAKNKDGPETTAQLKARWRTEAATAGFPVQRWLGQVFGRRTATKGELALARMGVTPSLELALVEAIDRLERSHSTWGRAQVVEALSVVLPAHKSGTAGQVRQVVEAAADMLLAHPDVIGLSCPERPDARHGSARYSTWWTLQTEQAVLDAVEAGRTAGVAVVPTHRVLADAGLGEDQDQAVRRLCSGGERVAVLVGPAGSGKSRTLGAARQGWEQAGIPVRGVAPSAVAAGVLTEQAGIPSDTLAKFLLEVANGRTRLNPGEVIVCDEASMVSTRDLATPARSSPTRSPSATRPSVSATKSSPPTTTAAS